MNDQQLDNLSVKELVKYVDRSNPQIKVLAETLENLINDKEVYNIIETWGKTKEW